MLSSLQLADCKKLRPSSCTLAARQAGGGGERERAAEIVETVWIGGLDVGLLRPGAAGAREEKADGAGLPEAAGFDPATFVGLARGGDGIAAVCGLPWRATA